MPSYVWYSMLRLRHHYKYISLLGNDDTTHCAYYITFLGSKIDTRWAGDKMNAQKRIKQLMAERGWTDYQLAKEADLSHSTISNMFNRNNAPTLPTIEALCRAFRITLSQFFAEGSESVELTERQREMLLRWNTLTEEQQKKLLDLMSTM